MVLLLTQMPSGPSKELHDSIQISRALASFDDGALSEGTFPL
jgi:hypothetical protein